MKAAKPILPSQRWYFIGGLLAIILAVLFWRSFAPDYVHFPTTALWERRTRNGCSFLAAHLICGMT